ncbi:hypothetical protein QIS74_04907 [Colletotrichum tabaci]|uniref:Uncharacterized protein n=1 Tax=Colletotrichum tabaci TaxID=1209068 RepID=A0AAV9TIS9_9PEZI
MVVLIKQHNSERHPVIPGTLHRAAADGEKGEEVARSAPAATSPPYNPAEAPFCNFTLNHLLANSPWLISPEIQSLLTGLFARNLQLDLASSSTKPPPGFVLFTRKTVSYAQTRSTPTPTSTSTRCPTGSSSSSSTPASARSAPLSAATTISRPTSSSPTLPAEPTIYQARDEAYAECNKLDDIRALDRVAQAHHTWRPKTCFGAGPCTLADVAGDFKKRSWSSSSGHATTDDSNAARLTCTTTATLRKPPSRKRQCVRRATPSSDSNGYWFYQEYVETLLAVEFRVYVVAEQYPTGMRGLRDCVARVCCTERTPDSHGALTATEAASCSYRNYGLAEHAVKSVALSVYEALCAGGTAGRRSFARSTSGAASMSPF